MSAASRALVIIALAAAPARAERVAEPALPRPWTGYVKIASKPPVSSAASSRIVYIERCEGGCPVHWATADDSRTGATTIAPEGTTRTIGPFKQGDAVWDELMACVRTTFAPFDIQITDVRPNGGIPYFRNIVGGVGTDLNPEFTNAGGVAPFNCGEVPNAITYTFDVYGPSPKELCWTVAQEVAHAFGLEHEFLQKDPLTYLGGDLPKRFRDVDAPCGEFMQLARCDCRSTPQNTYRHIVGMFGPGAPTPPELSIKYPPNGKQTQPGFVAVANANDDVRIERVELYIDGVLVTTAMAPITADDFELASGDVAQGPHTLEIKAFDVQGVEQSATVSFTQGAPCTPSTICKNPEVCVDGLCVAGPETPGGLGAICSSDVECLSHRCADAGEMFKHCVADCDIADDQSCPGEFSCISAGAAGVCWPTPGGGCCETSGGPQGSLLLALGLGVLVLRKRRR